MLRRGLFASFIAVFAAAGLVPANVLPAGAEEVTDTDDAIGRPYNHVQVLNRQDGQLRTKGKIAVAEESDGVVDNTNTALALASCTDCRTAAAAIQVIILETQASDVQPGNAAVAVNAGCLRCMTFAYAHQVMLSPFHPVTISDAARGQLKELDRRLDALLAVPDTPFDVLDQQLDALAAQVESVVQAEIDRSAAAVAAPAAPATWNEWDGELA